MSVIGCVMIKGLFKQDFDGYPGTDMTFFFDQEMNVIIGPNGTGKTTVLRLMHEFFGELDIDESADSAFAFYDKLSSSEIVWSTPFNSISFVIFDIFHRFSKRDIESFLADENPLDAIVASQGRTLGGTSGRALIIEKKMAGIKVGKADFLEISSTSQDTSIRVFSSAQDQSLILADHTRAIEIFKEIILSVKIHMVPVNRMVRIEESAFDDPRMLELMADDEIRSLFLDGQGVTLDLLPGVCKKWINEANEFWRDQLISLSSTIASGAYFHGISSNHHQSKFPTTEQEQITRASSLRRTAVDLANMGINLNGLNDDAILGRKDMTEFVYDLAGEMESDSAEVKKSYNLTLIHLENSIMQLQKKMKPLFILKLFIDKFFQGKHCSFSLEEGFSIRLDNHNPSYGAPANSTDILSLQSLSSGEKHALIMIVSVLQGDQDSLIMIDEPETSLHIEWQEQFLPWLQAAAQAVGCSLLITTHSPHMLSDHDCNVIKIPARPKNVFRPLNTNNILTHLGGQEISIVYPDVWKCEECNSPLIEQDDSRVKCHECGHSYFLDPISPFEEE
ncbi:MAG: hypothetical protein CMB26_03500 [Euryarchaeota archaeon]|nr:hypothetical protein [Euryarchaeota archaeon]